MRSRYLCPAFDNRLEGAKLAGLACRAVISRFVQGGITKLVD
jgi:hypothetical protein